MPELPEVETIVRELQAQLPGKTIHRLQCLNPSTLECSSAQVQSTVCGSTIRRISRRGKYICFHLENDTTFTVHLRMTGKILFNLTPREMPYVRLVFHLHDGSRFYFVDTRKFGRLKVWPVGSPLLPNLGPEPLNAKTVQFALEAQKTRRPIKSVLLDQAVLAGIGNIYADEALHRAGIHPLTPTACLSDRAKTALSLALPDILRQAVRRHGTTLSDYRTTRNRPGQQQHHLQVYGRAGETCLTCGRKINRMRIGGRSSYFCCGCQQRPR